MRVLGGTLAVLASLGTLADGLGLFGSDEPVRAVGSSGTGGLGGPGVHLLEAEECGNTHVSNEGATQPLVFLVPFLDLFVLAGSLGGGHAAGSFAVRVTAFMSALNR